jgi:hypothetical protein
MPEASTLVELVAVAGPIVLSAIPPAIPALSQGTVEASPMDETGIRATMTAHNTALNGGRLPISFRSTRRMAY